MPCATFPQVGRRIEVAPGQTILQAALEAGIPHPHGCRSGRCGACKSLLVTGHVELGRHSPFALSDAEHLDGLILPCRALPLDDVVVEWLDTDAAVRPASTQGATVAHIERKTHDILAIRLELEDRSAFRFAAGQYLELTVPGAPTRHYSMASTPDEPLVELYVKAVPTGRTSPLIHASLKRGDKVKVRGPAGTAYLREAHDGPIVAIAGGSGLAPIKSIVETALRAGLRQPIQLYFGARREEDLYLLDHFLALEQRFSNLSFIPVLSRARTTGWRSGYVSHAVGQDHRDLAGAKAYVAGTPAMVDAAGAILRARGISTSDIHADVFFTPETDIGAVA